MVFHKIPLILWYLVPFVHIKGKGLGIFPDEMHVIVLGGGGGPVITEVAIFVSMNFLFIISAC